MHTYTNAFTCVHTYIHTYIHTRRHTPQGYIPVTLLYYIGISFILGKLLINVFLAVLTTVYTAVRIKTDERAKKRIQIGDGTRKAEDFVDEDRDSDFVNAAKPGSDDPKNGGKPGTGGDKDAKSGHQSVKDSSSGGKEVSGTVEGKASVSSFASMESADKDKKNNSVGAPPAGPGKAAVDAKTAGDTKTAADTKQGLTNPVQVNSMNTPGAEHQQAGGALASEAPHVKPARKLDVPGFFRTVFR
jgi:hypothetical protein